MSSDVSKRARRYIRVARMTRPFMYNKPPVLYRLCQLLLKLCCPQTPPAIAVRLVTTYDGGLINVDTSSSLEYHLLFRGCHEPAITRLIERVVRPGACCIDVGANIGCHTLVMARAVGPQGRVIALEPHPRMCERLRRNVTLNQYAQVRVVQAALSDKDGESDFFGFSENASHHGISSLLPDAEATHRMRVRTLTGATLQREQNITACDFIKIDVEGAEVTALKELAGLIGRHRPVLTFEHRKQRWAKFGSSLRDAVDPLRALGYEFYVIRRDVMQPTANEFSDSCEIVCFPSRSDVS